MSHKLVIMGVSGCGKSSIGSLLAEALGLPFFDGDDYHPPANVEKMRCGQPLTDADRKPWLQALQGLIARQPGLVLACSALRPAYRELLRQGNTELRFVYLQGDFETIWARLRQRSGHYFNGESMLQSQFATLEEPTATEALFVDIRHPPEQIVNHLLVQLEA